MKTKIVLLFLLGWVGMAFGQEKTSDLGPTKEKSNSVIFTLDLSDPSISRDLISHTKRGQGLVAGSKELIAFRLINPNPFRYKYKLQKNFINFFGSATNSGKNEEKIFSSSKPTVTNESEDIENTKKTLESLKNTISSISKSTIKIKGKLSKQYNKEDIEKANEKIEKANTKLINLNSQLEQNNIAVTTLDSLSIKTFSDNEKEKIEKKLDEIRLNLSIINAKKYLYMEDRMVKDSTEAIEILQDALHKLSGKVSVINDEIKDYLQELALKESFDTKAYNIKISTIKKDYEKYMQYLANFEYEAKSFKDESLENAIKSISEKTISIVTNIDRLCNVNLENFLLPIDSHGENIDAVEITLTRYSADETPKFIDSNKYTIWIEGGLKLDVSAGVFITSLVNNEYYTEKENDTSGMYSIYKKDKGNFDFGFGSMLNLTYRSGGWANPTFGLGAIFTEKQKFQLISGFGLVMGKKERLILHGGLSMGQVERALGRFKDDGSQAYDLGSNPVIPTENKFRFGCFFGLSYNITGFKIDGKP